MTEAKLPHWFDPFWLDLFDYPPFCKKHMPEDPSRMECWREYEYGYHERYRHMIQKRLQHRMEHLGFGYLGANFLSSGAGQDMVRWYETGNIADLPKDYGSRDNCFEPPGWRRGKYVGK